MIRRIGMAGFLWLTLPIALAADWELIATTKEYTVHGDPGSVLQAGDTRKGRFRTVYTAQQTMPNGRKYVSEVTLWNFKCAEGTLTPAQVVLYSNAAATDEVFSYTSPPSELVYSGPPPGSIGEAVTDWICKALPLRAALAATGNDYPTPALFVKRWNLLAKTLPEAQITTFTSRGHENDPRPTAKLEGFDFASAGPTSLQIGASGVSVDYVTSPNYYSITTRNPPRAERGIRPFTQYCLWAIRSTRSSFTIRSAVQLFADAAHYVPPADATDRRRHAEAEGVSLTLRRSGEISTCEVREAPGK